MDEDNGNRSIIEDRTVDNNLTDMNLVDNNASRLRGDIS